MIKTFKCAHCSATLSYEGGPEAGVECPFCGKTTPVPADLRPQYDPVHEQLTDRPHPDHAPVRPVRISLDWRSASPGARLVIIFVIITFVLPTCLSLVAFGAGIFFSILGFIFGL
jgi:hypothetical protein